MSITFSKHYNRWGSKGLSDYSDFPSREVKRTVDEMTPDDVKKNAKGKIVELKRKIELYYQYISDYENELEFWESIEEPT